MAEAERYLKVGMINLLNAGKKDEKRQLVEEDRDNFSEEEVRRKTLQSRLDLLFGRYKLLNPGNKDSGALDSLTNSILSHSELYGPEDVGLTPQYYYLAECFYNSGVERDGKAKNDIDKKVCVKNIYNKVADNWRKFFMEQINPLFYINQKQEHHELIFAIGENYIRMIINRIASIFRDSEKELTLKFKFIKALVSRENNPNQTESLVKDVRDFWESFKDDVIDKEFMEEMDKRLEN